MRKSAIEQAEEDLKIAQAFVAEAWQNVCEAQALERIARGNLQDLRLRQNKLLQYKEQQVKETIEQANQRGIAQCQKTS